MMRTTLKKGYSIKSHQTIAKTREQVQERKSSKWRMIKMTMMMEMVAALKNSSKVETKIYGFSTYSSRVALLSGNISTI